MTSDGFVVLYLGGFMGGVVIAWLSLLAFAAFVGTAATKLRPRRAERRQRVEPLPLVADPVLRYPRLGETYIDRRPNALATVHRCTHPEYHGPRLCEPEWHEIVPEAEAEHHG